MKMIVAEKFAFVPDWAYTVALIEVHGDEWIKKKSGLFACNWVHVGATFSGHIQRESAVACMIIMLNMC